jgi:hypothetical protein
MAFTASIEGLDELRERLSSGTIEKKLVKAIGTTALQLHNVLNNRVSKTYATRRSLNSVLKSRTMSDFKRGVGFIEFGLEYNFMPILLQEFPVTKTLVPANSSFLAPNRFGYKEFPAIKGRLKRKKPNQQLAVRVKRNGSPTTLDKAFYGELPRDNKVYLMKRHVSNTWIDEPSPTNLKGKRDLMGILFGPSLSQMANSVYEKDPYLIKFRDTFADHVVRNLEPW